MDDRQFSQLLDRFGLSWRGYRKVRKGVKKRIRRHIQQLGCRSMNEYLLIMDGNPALEIHVKRLLDVSISRFFRDARLWSSLKETIIPHIVSIHPREVNVWSAGCALGQEVYSFKMLWTELSRESPSFPRLDLWATDVNPDYLKRAIDGVYDESMMKGIPEEMKRTYLHLSEDASVYSVTDDLKSGIRWEVYDLTGPSVLEERFHIIFLRNNLLTYYQLEIKQRAFRKVLTSLVEDGFLIIGSHETIPPQTDVLAPFEGCPFIFRKRSPILSPA